MTDNSLYHDNLRNLDWIFRAKFRKVVGMNLPARAGVKSSDIRFCMNCGSPVVAPGRFCMKCGRIIY